jgi:hypothetical protein
MKSDPDVFPAKLLLQEIETARGLLRAVVSAYSSRLEGELDSVRSKVEASGTSTKPSSGTLHDMRDMLTLLRHIDVKPEKGRRKDLKKLDSVISDLTLLVENW